MSTETKQKGRFGPLYKGHAGQYSWLLHRVTGLAIILATGHGIDDTDHLDWASLARTGQPIVVYMGMSNLPVIVNALRLRNLKL